MIQRSEDLAAGADSTSVQSVRPLRAAVRQPLLLVVIAVVFATHVCFAFQSRQVFSYDDSWYAETSLRLSGEWLRDGIPGAYHAFMDAFGGIKAPLIILLPQPLLLLFGRHDFVFLLVNPLCLIVASVYLAALARLLGLRRGIPLLVLIFSAMPLTVDMSRRFFVEILTTTLTLMFIYHAIRSERLTRRGHSLLAGLALGLGMLAKITFPLFVGAVPLLLIYEGLQRPIHWKRALAPLLVAVLGPLAAVTGAGHWSHPLSIGVAISAVSLLPLVWRGTRWQVNLAGALLLALWVPLPWYIRNAPTILNFAVSASVGELSMDYGSRELFSLHAIQVFWRENIHFGFGALYLAALLLVAVLLWAARLAGRGASPEAARLSRRLLWFLAAWILPALIAVTLGRNRKTRFIMPMLPGLAVFYALWFDQLARRARVLAWGAGGLYALGALGVLGILTFGGPIIHTGPGKQILFASPCLTSLSMVTDPPVPLAEIVARSRQLAAPRPDRPPLAVFLTATDHVNLNTALYEAAKTQTPILFGHVPYTQSANVPDVLEQADLLVYQEGGSDFSSFPNRGGRVVLDRLRSGGLPGWRMLSGPVVRLPAGGVVRFVERIPNPAAPALEPCLVRYGPFALISYHVDCNDRGLRLVTCWQKQAPDNGQYAVAAHLVNRDSTYSFNIDHAPPPGPEAFARMAVGDVVTAVKEQPPGQRCPNAEYVDISLYDIDHRTSLPCTVMYGLESRPGQAARLRLPPFPSSVPSPATAPTN